MIDPELMLQIVRNEPVIAYDTETSGLEATDFICGYVVTSWGESLYTPVRHEGGGNIPNVEEFEAELAAAFRDRARLGYRTVGHHLGFDLRASLRHGVVLGSPLEDTMLNESLIDDTTIGYSLDECAKRRGVTAKLGTELYAEIARRYGGLPDKKQMAHFYKMPGDHPLVVDYACGDGTTTLELWERQQRILDDEDVRTVWKLECDLLPYLARMHHRGMKVDHDYAAKIDVDLKKSIEAAKLDFAPGFNPRSPGEVEKLFRDNGFTDDMFARTDGGKPSFTEKWLKGNPIGDKILGIRQLEKAKDSFIKPIVETKNINGRIHPVLHQSKSDDFGVAGARLSCSDPNMQAQPKRNKRIGKIVRPLIIPDSGMIIEEADFKQQEPRFFTFFSREPALLEGYQTGTMDIHDRASEVLNIPRDYAKRLGLGMLTMMSPKTLALHMGYTLAEAKRDHRLFLTDAFPMINEFQQDVIAVFKQRGYVKSILGRKARRDGPIWAAYKGVSRVIQNSGGDHMKTALLRANQYEDAYPNEVQMLLSIHDSNIWQRDPGHDTTELVRVIENVVFEPEFGMDVPIPVDIGSGLNWGEASYGK